MFNRKQQILLTLFTIIVILVLGVVSYFLMSRQTPKESISTPSIMGYTGKERVFVADLYNRTDSETKISIERMLYSSLDKDQPDMYTGTIRAESFTEELLASKQTMSTFLVDTEPRKMTYKVTLYSSPQGGRPSIMVDCAPQDEQIDSFTICKDVHHHE